MVVSAQAGDLEKENLILKEEVRKLQLRNKQLVDSLVASNLKEEQCAKTLSKLQIRLSALGKSILSDDNERLMSALSDIELLTERLNVVESSALSLTESYNEMVNTIEITDPNTRAEVESDIRQLEAAVGLRNAPIRPITKGNLQSADVVSVDSETGLIVLNVGSLTDTRIGMRFQINRGNREIAKTIVAEVRNSICGVLVEQQAKSNFDVKLGDTARVILN